MLLIAICDDNEDDRQSLYHTLENFLNTKGIQARLFAYDSPNKLNSVIENKSFRFDIIFLDIIMGDMNGMECARFIRQQDKLVKIIFLTNSTDYVFEGYDVKATGYLIKPIKTDQLNKVLNQAITEISDIEKNSIYITNRGITQRIPIDDILYLESENNKVNIFLAKNNEKITVYNKLNDFEQQQIKTFIRSHKSYLVNFLYIEKYANDKFILTDKTIIPISRKNREKAKETFYHLLSSQ
ncbi:MAG TPA: LytTR family DNA-binding domain-containing protein [Bacillota bacterium]|nr:LytTR family DNA-binding domain-containing protein [Bacillota bacterium]